MGLVNTLLAGCLRYGEIHLHHRVRITTRTTRLTKYSPTPCLCRLCGRRGQRDGLRLFAAVRESRRHKKQASPNIRIRYTGVHLTVQAHKLGSPTRKHLAECVTPVSPIVGHHTNVRFNGIPSRAVRLQATCS